LATDAKFSYLSAFASVFVSFYLSPSHII